MSASEKIASDSNQGARTVSSPQLDVFFSSLYRCHAAFKLANRQLSTSRCSAISFVLPQLGLPSLIWMAQRCISDMTPNCSRRLSNIVVTDSNFLNCEQYHRHARHHEISSKSAYRFSLKVSVLLLRTSLVMKSKLSFSFRRYLILYAKSHSCHH